DDALNGGPGNDVLYGQAGNDTLAGDDGNDWLEDATGSNQFDGGAGEDTFAHVGYSEGAAGGVDTITTGAGRDTIRLDGYTARYAPAALFTDVVTDFTAGDNGDVIDLSDLTDDLLDYPG